jgi:hypothetical protein
MEQSVRLREKNRRTLNSKVHSATRIEPIETGPAHRILYTVPIEPEASSNAIRLKSFHMSTLPLEPLTIHA